MYLKCICECNGTRGKHESPWIWIATSILGMPQNVGVVCGQCRLPAAMSNLCLTDPIVCTITLRWSSMATETPPISIHDFPSYPLVICYRTMGNHGKSPCVKGKSTISMAMFNSYQRISIGSRFICSLKPDHLGPFPSPDDDTDLVRLSFLNLSLAAWCDPVNHKKRGNGKPQELKIK